MAASLLNLDKYGKEESYLPGTGRIFLFTEKDASDQCGHNYLQVEAAGSPRYFTVATSFEGRSLNVCPGSHLYHRYHK